MELLNSTPHYKWLFKRSKKTTKKILVVFSPFSGFMLKHSNFEHDTLYIHESVNSYYTFKTDKLTADIFNIAEKLRKNELILLGSSKSAYPAIFCGRSISEGLHLRKCKSICFSPVTRVYPLKKNLPFSTYPPIHRTIE